MQHAIELQKLEDLDENAAKLYSLPRIALATFEPSSLDSFLALSVQRQDSGDKPLHFLW